MRHGDPRLGSPNSPASRLASPLACPNFVKPVKIELRSYLNEWQLVTLIRDYEKYINHYDHAINPNGRTMKRGEALSTEIPH